MILIQATIKYKGYDPNNLKLKSNKRICRSCDSCGKIDWIIFYNYNKQKNKNLCNSCSKSGKLNYNYNKLMSNNQKIKIRKSKIGKCSNELNPMYGKHHSIETKIKLSCTQRNIKIKDFVGFKTRDHVKREYKCIKLNNKIKGFDGHHIMKSVIIYLPRNIHQNIQHNMKSGKNMDIINMVALQYLKGGF